jgi:hypothetical protein
MVEPFHDIMMLVVVLLSPFEGNCEYSIRLVQDCCACLPFRHAQRNVTGLPRPAVAFRAIGLCHVQLISVFSLVAR